MACSYLSATGMGEASGAACWTPPSMACLPLEIESPSTTQPGMYLRPHAAPLNLPIMPVVPPQCPVAARSIQEPALDLTTSSTILKSHLPSPPSDDEAE